MRLLLVEDDDRIATPIKEELEFQYYIVDKASDGEQAISMARKVRYDLVLLDLLLPKTNGMTVCNTLRADGFLQPILMMTALGTTHDKVAGLDAGADDYIVKPFELEELLARVRAMLRRGKGQGVPLLHWGQVTIDPAKCVVTYKDKPIALTATEYRLLAFFLRHPDETFSKEAIFERLWLPGEESNTDVIKTYVKLLRRKMSEAGVPVDPLETIYGFGYRLKSLK
jgi:two-component system response regulator QseB